jgi:hypothetical protein
VTLVAFLVDTMHCFYDDVLRNIIILSTLHSPYQDSWKW